MSNSSYVIYSIAFVDEWIRKIIDAAARARATKMDSKKDPTRGSKRSWR